MAARRGKTQARRNHGRGGGLPGWAWLVLGAVLAAIAVLWVPKLMDRKEGDGFFRPTPNPDAQPAAASDEERTRTRNEHIGFVFQFHFLMLEFTALENVMIPMRKLGRLASAEMEARAKMLLESVGLGAKTHRLATHLSGGEQQRVAIARALANQPSILLADEPTGNLDVKNSTIVFDLMTRLAREHGQAIVLVTHNPDIANRCDRVRPMRDGVFV